MVYFLCCMCNESIKKNKVDEHCSRRCRSAEYVSCVDCGTDFYGDDYRNHTVCISEAEKYGGKDYVENPSAQKGQKKQDVWVQKVLNVARTAATSDSNVKKVLDSLHNYQSFPQKKPKFINFLKNSFPWLKRNEAALLSVWNLIEKAKNSPQTAEQSESSNATQNGMTNAKRKKARTLEEVTEEEVQEVREAKRKKREEKTTPNNENVVRLNDTLQEEEAKKPKNFSIPDIVIETLEKKGEISLKRLRKKVVSEYVSHGKFMKSEEQIWKKLDKALRSLDNVVLSNDRVSLKEES